MSALDRRQLSFGSSIAIGHSHNRASEGAVAVRDDLPDTGNDVRPVGRSVDVCDAMTFESLMAPAATRSSEARDAVGEVRIRAIGISDIRSTMQHRCCLRDPSVSNRTAVL